MILFHMKLHCKCIHSVLAFGRYPARVFFYDAFGNGKTETVAVVHLPCFITAVKPLEDVFQFFFEYCTAVILAFQSVFGMSSGNF